MSKNKMKCCLGNLESGHCGGRKNMVLCFFHSKSHFQPFFFFIYPKHLENTLETLLNQSMAAKKLINHPKTWNPPELRYVVLGIFKVNKHLNVTSPYYIESFETKINRFGSQNLPQWPFSISPPNRKRLKKVEMKLGTKMYCLQI
jgi:hypothetical protein